MTTTPPVNQQAPLLILKNVSPHSNERGNVLTFSKPRILIGRGEDCDIRPMHKLVSRHHCVIEIRPDGVWVEDLNSANGTYLRNDPIQGSKKVASGDVVVIGLLCLEVQIPQPGQGAPITPGEERVLRWVNDFQEGESVESAQTMRAGEKPSEDTHRLGLTRAIVKAIESYLARHPDVQKSDVKALLRELADTL